MAARDRYEVALACERCGTKGTALISEEDHPWVRGDIGRTVDDCPPGFKVVPGQSNSADTRIICATCGSRVYGPGRDLFAEAITLATSGRFKSCAEVERDMQTRGMPSPAEFRAFEGKRAYIGELCAKNYGRR